MAIGAEDPSGDGVLAWVADFGWEPSFNRILALRQVFFGEVVKKATTIPFDSSEWLKWRIGSGAEPIATPPTSGRFWRAQELVLQTNRFQQRLDVVVDL